MEDLLEEVPVANATDYYITQSVDCLEQCTVTEPKRLNVVSHNDAAMNTQCA